MKSSASVKPVATDPENLVPDHHGTSYPDPIPGIILQGSTNLFMGSPRAGKTIEGTSLALRLRDGKNFAGLPTNPQSVGIITTDHRWRLDQGFWYTKAGWPDVPHVSLRDRHGCGWKVDWFKFKREEKERIRILRFCLKELNLPVGTGTLFIDVGQPFITNKLNDYMEVMAGLNALGEITYDEHGLTVILFGHMGKQREGDGYRKVQDKGLGSVGQAGFTDTMITLQSPMDLGEDDHPAEYSQIEFLTRQVAEVAFKLTRDEEGFFIPYTGKLNPDDPTAPAIGLDRPTDLLALIPDHLDGVETGHLVTLAMEQFHVSRKTVFRDLAILKQRQQIEYLEHGRIRRRKPS